MRIFLAFVFLFTCTFFMTALAAMEPAEDEKIKNGAPVHLIGTVIDDKLDKELPEQHFQERKMQLQIDEVKRQSLNIGLPPSIWIDYTYIPDWLEMEGGRKMDVAVSDRIEIWLEPTATGWQPVLSGDSVHHLSKASKRPEHMAAPLESWPAIARNKLQQLPLFVWTIMILICLLSTTAFLMRKFTPVR